MPIRRARFFDLNGGKQMTGRRKRSLIAIGGAMVTLVGMVVVTTTFMSGALAASTPTAPFTECPAVGYNTSCTDLINVTPTGSQVLLNPLATVHSDPTRGTYDGADTLVGVINNTSRTIYSVPVTSTMDIMGFDGDGICANPNPQSGLPGLPAGDCADVNHVDSTGFGGPDSYFRGISPMENTGTVEFITPLAPGASTYFSLVGSLTWCSITVPGSITLKPPHTSLLTGATDTSTATVDSGNGSPIPDTTVTFKIVSGPNKGKTGTGVTNASGSATFKYSSSVVGTDTISASYVDPINCATITSNLITVTWHHPAGCRPVVKHVFAIGNARMEIVRVLIVGDCFKDVTGVTFGSVAAPPGTFTVNSDDRIVVSPPQQPAGTVNVTVTTADGGTSAINAPADQYTYYLPRILQVIPNHGPVAGGNTVIIRGSGFSGRPAPTVSFGGVPSSSVTVMGDDTIRALVPPHSAGTVDVVVTTYAGASLPAQYKYK
jgi:hypothetical protein